MEKRGTNQSRNKGQTDTVPTGEGTNASGSKILRVVGFEVEQIQTDIFTPPKQPLYKYFISLQKEARFMHILEIGEAKKIAGYLAMVLYGLNEGEFTVKAIYK